jgi:hypothetical protein
MPTGQQATVPPVRGQQNHQFPPTPTETPTNGQFSFPSPTFPSPYRSVYPHLPIQPTNGSGKANPQSISAPGISARGQSISNKAPEKLAWSQPMNLGVSPLSLRPREQDKRCAVIDIKNWALEFPGVQFPGTINSRKKPEHGPLLDLSEYDKASLDLDISTFFTPTDSIDPKLSIGQSSM